MKELFIKTELFLNRRWVRTILYTVLLLIFCYFVIAFSFVIFNPLISEFREGHTLVPVYLIHNGITPWTIGTYPEFYNSYGIVFSLVVYPFALIFGNSLILYRVINEACLLLTIWLVLYYRKTKSLDFARVIIILMLFILFNHGSNITVRPDGIGTLFFSLTLLLPIRNNYKRRFIFAAIILGIISFYIKPYYFLGWYLLSVLLLFKNVTQCIKYNIVFHALFVLVAVLIFRIFPLYFYETIFAYSSTMANVDNTGDSVLARNLLLSAKQYFVFVFKALPLLMILLFYSKKEHFRIHKWFILSMIICAVFLFYPLGTNDGAFLTYHVQLLLPMIAIYIVEILDKRRIPALYISLIILVLVGANKVGRLRIGQQCESEDWHKVMSYVDNNKKILNSPLISPLLMQRNKQGVDYGVAGFVFFYKPSPLTEALFGLDAQILAQKERYIRGLRDDIFNQRFDVIMLTHIDNHLKGFVDLSKYEKIDELKLDSYETNYIMSVYKPRKDN